MCKIKKKILSSQPLTLIDMADVRIAEDWKAILAEEFSKPYFDELVGFVKQEYSSGVVFP